MGYHDRWGSPDGHDVYMNWPPLSLSVRELTRGVPIDDQPNALTSLIGQTVAFFNGSQVGAISEFFIYQHPNDREGLYRSLYVRIEGIEEKIDPYDERWNIKPKEMMKK